MAKAVIFDFDDVVALTEGSYMDSFDSMMERQGYGLRADREEWFRRFSGTGLMHILETVFRERGFETKESLEAWLERWNNEYKNLMKNKGVKPVRGFPEFNKELNRLGVKKIIATGSHTGNVLLVLKLLGLEKFQIVSIEDVKNGKPDPEIFLLAAQRLGIPPADCIVFEDSVAGIRAAKAAGMKCIALATTAPRDVLEREGPDLVVKDYTELNVNDLLG